MRHMTLQAAGDGFATLLLDNADESNNLVTEEFIAELLEVAARIAADDSRPFISKDSPCSPSSFCGFSPKHLSTYFSL